MTAIVKQAILASTSRYRQKILQTTGLSFICADSRIDEENLTDPDPAKVARIRSIAKAQVVAERNPGCLVIGADQTLALGSERLSKVQTPDLARACLSHLAGKTHYLHSGYCLSFCSEMAASKPMVLTAEVISTAMIMRHLTASEIKAYVATGEWQGTVGCYQYENRGIHLFSPDTRPEMSAVVGLPLGPLLAALRAIGVNPLLQNSPPWVMA